MDAQAAALLSLTEIILFLSKGVTVPGSKTGPLPLQEEWEEGEGVSSLLESTGISKTPL